jgi:hypothetical protein
MPRNRRLAGCGFGDIQMMTGADMVAFVLRTDGTAERVAAGIQVWFRQDQIADAFFSQRSRDEGDGAAHAVAI